MGARRVMGALLPFALVLVIAQNATGSQFLGWADKFLVASIYCGPDPNGQFDCSPISHWIGDRWIASWSFVGAQGSDSTGKANAVEEVFTRFRDHDSNGYT